jgi:hypothetical protein
VDWTAAIPTMRDSVSPIAPRSTASAMPSNNAGAGEDDDTLRFLHPGADEVDRSLD